MTTTKAKATPTTKATTPEKTPTTFADLVKKYNDESNHPTTPTTYTKALTDLATATAYAVLKKVINTTSNPTLTKIRQELTADLANLDRLAYASERATKTTYTPDGDRKIEIADRDCYDALTDICRRSFGDGLDLVHDAITAILEQTAKQTERDPEKPTDLERPYTVRRLNRKVWIKTAESVGAWETKETTPIQEIFKAVRRSIDQSRAVQTDPRNGYSYIDDIATDPESGATDRIYRRLDKYADLGGYACDFNGKETVYTTDPTAVDTTDRLLAEMNLTTRQMQVLKLRQRGYGKKAIAQYLGISPNSVYTCLQCIQAKAVKIGLTPTPTAEK